MSRYYPFYLLHSVINLYCSAYQLDATIVTVGSFKYTTLSTLWVRKGCHLNHGYNFVNSRWMCKLLSLLQRAVNFQQNQY